MRKMRKLFGFVLFFMIAVLVSVVLVQASIQSTKNSYLTTQPVYARSTTLLCPGLPQGENLDLYIVENKDIWIGDEVLSDVRDFSQEVPNSVFSYKQIWETPEEGDYDIVVDCNADGKYNYLLEPIDSFDSVGFRVSFEKGSASAFIGQKDVGNHSWQYDPEEPDLINEMLQLSVLAVGEDIRLENITIQAQGLGNDTEIDKLEIYIDENNNGRLDVNDVMIGDSQPAYAEDNAETSILLDYVLTKNLTENLLIVYIMKETVLEGEFSLNVKSIYGEGTESGEIIKFSGFPVSSGLKTVLPKKTCLGGLTLELEPNPADESSNVAAKMNNLSGCQNKTIFLRTSTCPSIIFSEVGSCVAGGTGCELSFVALENKRYYACIDKNEDGDMVDFGENVFEDLIVIIEEIEEENITEEFNISENITQEEIGITGGAIEELRKKLSDIDGFFILMEITLLLILLILVFISFKLMRPTRIRRARRRAGEKEEEKEEKEEKEE